MKRVFCFVVAVVFSVLSGCTPKDMPTIALPESKLTETLKNSPEETENNQYTAPETNTETPLETITETASSDMVEITLPASPETVPPPTETEPTKKESMGMIALTFDDGPGKYTDRLLDIFKENGGKATFFVVGNIASYRRSTIKRMEDEGHEIGNHTWNHMSLIEANYQEVIDQITLARDTITSITGKDCNIVRPPYGAFNSDVAAIGEELGVSFIGWSLDTLDWLSRDPQIIYDEVICRATTGQIILLHDIHETTIDAMEMVIPELIDSGYELVTVSELLTQKRDRLTPGVFYSK